MTRLWMAQDIVGIITTTGMGQSLYVEEIFMHATVKAEYVNTIRVACNRKLLRTGDHSG